MCVYIYMYKNSIMEKYEKRRKKGRRFLSATLSLHRNENWKMSVPTMTAGNILSSFDNQLFSLEGM